MLNGVVSWWVERNGNRALTNVTGLNVVEQKAIADFVRKRIQPGTGDASSRARLAEILQEATGQRKLALQRGAASEHDPLWSAAAIVESWATLHLAASETGRAVRANRYDARVSSFLKAFPPDT